MSFEDDFIEIYNKRIIPAYQTLVPLDIKKAVKETYDFQQSKIDQLEKENKDLIGENSAMAGYLNDAKSLFVPNERWDNFVKAYSMIKRAERIDANDFYERSQESAHYNWLDEQNENLEKQLEEAEKIIRKVDDIYSADLMFLQREAKEYFKKKEK